MGHDSEVTERLLKALAKKYIWWRAPDASLLDERRIIAQVMNIGDFYDVAEALSALGPARFMDALAKAEPGWFSPKSWAYWHYRCGITAHDQSPPPLPSRRLAL